MREEIIKMALEAGMHIERHHLASNPVQYRYSGGGYGEALERFFHMAQAAEREAISNEWWMCVQSDLENGVKSLNEIAADKWKRDYPEVSKFGAWLEARGQA